MVVVVAVVNPRAFVRLREALRGLGLVYKVPDRLPYECKPNEIALYDVDGTVLGECKTIRVASAESVDEIVPKIFLVKESKQRFAQLIAGIDLGGSTHAIVVIGDGTVIGRAKGGERVILEYVKRFGSTPHKSFVVKIGGTRSNLERAYELGWKIALECGVPVLVVDETSTTREGIIRSETKALLGDPDLVAAYRIALREKRE